MSWMNVSLILMNGKKELGQNCPVTLNVMGTVLKKNAPRCWCQLLLIWSDACRQTKLKARIYWSTIDHKVSPLDTTAMEPGLSKNLPVSHISQHTDTCTLRRNVDRPVSRHPCTHPYRQTHLAAELLPCPASQKNDRKELAFLFLTVKKKQQQLKNRVWWLHAGAKKNSKTLSTK